MQSLTSVEHRQLQTSSLTRVGLPPERPPVAPADSCVPVRNFGLAPPKVEPPTFPEDDFLGFGDLESPEFELESRTLIIQLDLPGIDFHKTFYLRSQPALPDPPHPPPPQNTSVALPSNPQQSPFEADLTRDPRRAIPSTNLEPSPQSQLNSPPGRQMSYIYQKSVMAPLSGHSPDLGRKPRLEDQKLIEFLLHQRTRNYADNEFLTRVQKTIRKIRLYWHHDNPVYPFAFRKLRNRPLHRDRRAAEHPSWQTLVVDGWRKDAGEPNQNYFVITEDFSNKQVNPEGTTRFSSFHPSKNQSPVRQPESQQPTQ